MDASGGPPVVPPAQSSLPRPMSPLASLPSSSARSFKDALFSSLAPPVIRGEVHCPASTDNGEPAVFFSKEEISASLQPFSFAVVARTPFGRPPFPDIRSHLRARCDFKDDFMISSLDPRHLLLRFRNHDDFLSVLLRDTLFVHGKLFKFFKWSLDFSPDSDSPVLPIWIAFPFLPVNFFLEPMLRSVAGNIGKVLKIDSSTSNLSNTSAARVCVELDISKIHPSRIWIGYPGGGFWQDVLYPNFPLFCSHCSKLGHNVDSCKMKLSLKRNADKPGSKIDCSPTDAQPRLISKWQPILSNQKVADQVTVSILERPLPVAPMRANVLVSDKASPAAASRLVEDLPSSSALAAVLPNSNSDASTDAGPSIPIEQLASYSQPSYAQMLNNQQCPSNISGKGLPSIQSPASVSVTIEPEAAHRLQAKQMAGVVQEGCYGRLKDSIDSQKSMETLLVDQAGTGDCPFPYSDGNENDSLEILRKEIASDAAVDNVRTLLTEPARIITRSMTRSGSLGDISELVHK